MSDTLPARLPHSWVQKQIGDLFEVIGGGTPETSESTYWNGKTPWITSADIHGVRDISVTRYVSDKGIENSATNKVPARTLLVVTRVGLGKVAISKEEICFSQDLQGLVAPNNLILPEYALHYLSAELQRLKFEGRGTTISGVTKKQLKDTPFPLAPLKEQRRIVAKIEKMFSELDKGVESLTAAREQLKAYRQSVLKHAFEGKLTEGWRVKNPDKVQTPDQLLARLKASRESVRDVKGYELSNLPPLPSGYIYTYLSNLGDLARGKSKHRPRNDPRLFQGKYPFIQTGEVRAANRTVRDFHQTYNEAGLAQSHLWPKGTLCITIAANIAETAFLGFDACFPDSVVGFTAQPEIALPEYVELFIKAVRVRIEAYAPATAQKNINLTTLENLIIPLCSLEEQKYLVGCAEQILSVADANDADAQDNIARCEALRQSILKLAFSGKLVAQEASDEPAAVLLERIRSGQEGAKKRYTNKNGKKEAA